MSDETEVKPPTHTVLTDDDILSFSQGTRKQLVDEITQNGLKLPQDTEDRSILLKALSDMDKTALGNKRIKAQEGQNESDVQIAKAMAKLSEQFGNNNPFAGNATGRVIDIEHDKIPRVDAVPGETEVGVGPVDYSEVMGEE